jgi:hypothetical protein
MRLPALTLCLLLAAAPSGASPFGDDFWRHWGDGRAELASYDLTYSRYGELREGTAVTIFVTETFSDEARVKADPGVHPKSDEFPVLKLNLVQDFATGIYDYNLMTSAFVALAPRHGRGAGVPSKVSFSSQEWCGHVFHQILPDEKSIRHEMRSYFDREADRDETLEYPDGGLLEDTLFHWARGFAAPFLGPGEEADASVLRSVENSRLRHVPLDWKRARLSRSASTQELTVPAGIFDVETLHVDIGGGARTWTFFVEKLEPRRIIRWEASDGRHAELIASTRTAYWQQNGNRDLEALGEIGLKPRARRMP